MSWALVNICMSVTIGAGDYDLGRVGQRDAAVVTGILLDTDREQAPVIGLLPLFHTRIQSTH